MLFFFKQKTAYEMLLCDWSSDVCSSDLTADCATAQNQLRALEATSQPETGPIPPLSVRQAFLQRPEFSPDRTGLLRVLHELGDAGADPAAGRGTASSAPADAHPRHIRLPMVSESLTAATLLWSAFFRSAVPDTVSILLISRSGVDWLDVIIGPPAAEDFFCLQASPKALPLATEIPYDLAPDLRTRLQDIESRFLGATPQKLAAPTIPTATTVRVSAPAPAPPDRRTAPVPGNRPAR